jgi:hypothetical protein
LGSEILAGPFGPETTRPARKLLRTGLVNVFKLQRLAISVEAVRAEPLLMAEKGLAAGKLLTAIKEDGAGADIDWGDDRRRVSEADSNRDLGLGLGGGREQERAGGDCGDDCFGGESFCIGEFHNGLLTTHE